MKPFRMRGTVIHGFGRGGSQLGYPTANIDLNDDVIAQLQPYKGLVICGFGCVEPAQPADDSATRPSSESNGPFMFAMSVGNNPHFKNKELSVEVYFLHKFEQDFYGSVIRILSLHEVRQQAAFNSLEELVAAIDGDVEQTKACLSTQEYATFQSDPFVNPDIPVNAGASKTPFFALL